LTNYQIVSTTHVLAPLPRTLLARTLRTHNIHSETLLNLSPSNNIGDAYRRFGITDSTTSLIVIKIGYPVDHPPPNVDAGKYVPPTKESVQEFLGQVVEGESRAFSEDEVVKCGDLNRIRKTYKIGNEENGGGKGGKKRKMAVNGEFGGHDNVATSDIKSKMLDERKMIESAVLGMMALRGS
jgi:EKC/KEOPS complex subunit CGI121/TPRKB